jgi:hypothetical protein
VKRIVLNVDFDGVLIPNYHEKRLIEKLSNIPLTNKIRNFESRVFDWYIDMVNNSPFAPLNVRLLDYFVQNVDKYVIRLWTNRNQGLVKKTIANLDGYARIFDSFQFHEGSKIDSRVEGIVIDNDPKYLKCGEFGIHYEWKGV